MVRASNVIVSERACLLTLMGTFLTFKCNACYFSVRYPFEIIIFIISSFSSFVMYFFCIIITTAWSHTSVVHTVLSTFLCFLVVHITWFTLFKIPVSTMPFSVGPILPCGLVSGIPVILSVKSTQHRKVPFL